MIFSNINGKTVQKIVADLVRRETKSEMDGRTDREDKKNDVETVIIIKKNRAYLGGTRRVVWTRRFRC